MSRSSDTLIPPSIVLTLEASPLPTIVCGRCQTATPAATSTPIRGTDHRVCPGCRLLVCQDCGVEAGDVLQRALSQGNPAICTLCCSRYPGRAWMRGEGSDGPTRDG